MVPVAISMGGRAGGFDAARPGDGTPGSAYRYSSPRQAAGVGWGEGHVVEHVGEFRGGAPVRRCGTTLHHVVYNVEMTGPPPPAHNIRATHPVRACLRALAEADHQTAAELMETTGYPSGTLYPVLRRLVDYGLASIEEQPSPFAGAPPRHIWTLTEDGRTHPTVTEHPRATGKATP